MRRRRVCRKDPCPARRPSGHRRATLEALVAPLAGIQHLAQLLDRVWGDHVFIEERTVDVHVKRLREALAPAQCAQMVETVRGAGYRLTRAVATAS